jgi:hypothetical protein
MTEDFIGKVSLIIAILVAAWWSKGKWGTHREGSWYPQPQYINTIMGICWIFFFVFAFSIWAITNLLRFL